MIPRVKVIILAHIPIFWEFTIKRINFHSICFCDIFVSLSFDYLAGRSLSLSASSESFSSKIKMDQYLTALFFIRKIPFHLFSPSLFQLLPLLNLTVKNLNALRITWQTQVKNPALFNVVTLFWASHWAAS